MSDDIPMNAGPGPAWLGEPLLKPGERVVLWRGPRDGRLAGWLKGHVGLLFAGAFAAFPVFAFAGKGLGMLLGGGDGWTGLRIGLTLAFGWYVAALAMLFWALKDVFHVLTDRRFLVIRGRELVEASN